MAGTDTITIFRGEDAALVFTMAPVVDITGWTILFTIQDASVSVAAAVTDGPAGEFTVSLTDDHTEQRAGTYQYDAWRTDPGVERCLAVGELVIADVARDTA